MSDLPPYLTKFLHSCHEAGALKFGSFTLKSGRESPYFFNIGLFHRADLLVSMSEAFAHTIRNACDSGALQPFTVLFGPAYKGIPLSVATVDKLAQQEPAKFSKLSYSFNRKEAKDHGEGGTIVGAPLSGQKVVIIDDVITAGTAIKEAIDIIKKLGGQLAGILVAVDRQECMDLNDVARNSAIGEIRRSHKVPVLSILTLEDVISYAKANTTPEDVQRLEKYRKQYMASD